MIKLSESLHHLSDEDKQKVDKLDEKIYELQGKCTSYADTLKLSELYRKREEIIKGRRKIIWKS